MTILLLALAATGLVIASYFTAVAFRWVRADAAWVPPFCRMDEQTCASIVFTPQARIFGPPNSVLGQVYYAALLAGTAVGWIDNPLLRWGYLAASLATVTLGVYLSYALLFINRVPCILCFTSHGINVVILVLLILRGS